MGACHWHDALCAASPTQHGHCHGLSDPGGLQQPHQAHHRQHLSHAGGERGAHYSQQQQQWWMIQVERLSKHTSVGFVVSGCSSRSRDGSAHHRHHRPLRLLRACSSESRQLPKAAQVFVVSRHGTTSSRAVNMQKNLNVAFSTTLEDAKGIDCVLNC